MFVFIKEFGIVKRGIIIVLRKIEVNGWMFENNGGKMSVN